ncbi:uncharacterized protein JCM10292_005604 [Rhodotorula paludigena]|uniref:uncharacterized protein n=1 Tax=Rhodotorula paludigena TaxID=86838 RepID=UPI003177554F
MLDQLAGRPSPSWRRSQVWLVLLFWISRIVCGPAHPPNLPLLRRVHAAIRRRFSPWQVVLSTLTLLYAVRHGDVLLGLQAPEPLARLYSRDYYRATWVTTALDAGFATAMSIRWKWLRDLASLAFSGYYLLFANEADEKLRKFRAFCTVEMLRVTWEKTTNPYIHFATRRHRPPVEIQKKVFLPRPEGSRYSKPITLHLYYAGSAVELASAHELVMDLPGGGFICMTPEHHAERLLRWARQLGPGKVIISFDYGKAPEYPFPFAIDEMYDAYSLLHTSKGKCIGMNMRGEKDLKVVMTGDSAGANIATAMVIKILETPSQTASPSPTSVISLPNGSTATPPTSTALPLPVALVFAYPALSFHFTSWMPSSDLRVLRSESSPDVATLLRQKDHLEHRSPLAVVEDPLERRSAGSERGRPKVLRRRRTTSWGRGLVRGLPGSASFAAIRDGASFLSRSQSEAGAPALRAREEGKEDEEDEEEVAVTDEREKSLSERVVWWDGAAAAEGQAVLGEEVKRDQGEREELLEGKWLGKGKGVLGETRLAMTSRTAFFNDRIISPPMCRAMALLYIGPRNAPDLHSDYHISPIFTPPQLLARFPPVYMSCGERDPFVDDTVIFAGKLREAKESRKLELLAREHRVGDTLRMSSSSASAHDPLLDEDEDDWVRTSIIAGWSHGYLQMVSLLPAAEKVIAMHADWIAEAFETAKEKDDAKKATAGKATPISAQQSRRIASPVPASSQIDKPINVVPPTPTIEQNRLPHLANNASDAASSALSLSSGSASGEAAEADERDDEEVLTFTPKRRRGSSNTSRTGSPTPSLPTKTMPSVETVLGNASGRAASHGEHGASDRIVTPVERALREDLHASPLVKHNPPTGSAMSSTSPLAPTPTGAPRARSATPSGPRSPQKPHPAAQRSISGGAAGIDESERSLSPVPPAGSVKTGRSSSSSSLPPPQGAVFIDAKELLRRRRDDIVTGISVNNSRSASRAGSRRGSHGEEKGVESDEEGGKRIARRKTMDA